MLDIAFCSHYQQMVMRAVAFIMKCHPCISSFESGTKNARIQLEYCRERVASPPFAAMVQFFTAMAEHGAPQKFPEVSLC